MKRSTWKEIPSLMGTDDLTGKRVGQYTLHEMISRGGMAAVYRAHQPSIPRDVAIKIITPRRGQNPAAGAQFAREAVAASRLQHPHILPVYDVEVNRVPAYVVMALMTGGTLARRINQHPGGMPLTDAVQIVAQIADALDHAHQRGMIHRDVKPGNILFDAQGHAYLADFGIACLYNGELSGGKAAFGTYAYMAPELLDGTPASPTSDIYALGMIIYEMLAGRRPYDTRDLNALKSVRRRWPGIPDLNRPGLPHGVQVVVEQALNRDPASRPPRAGALAAALTHAAGRDRSTRGVPIASVVFDGLPPGDDPGLEAAPPTPPDLPSTAASAPTRPRRVWSPEAATAESTRSSSAAAAVILWGLFGVTLCCLIALSLLAGM